MSTEDFKLIHQFLNEKPLFNSLIEGSVQLLRSSMAKNGLRAYAVASRRKSLASILEKMDRKGKKFEDIKDRGGVRIICSNVNTIGEVIQLIKEVFIVEEVEDISQRQGVSHFGYSASHCVVRWDKKNGKLISAGQFNRIGSEELSTYFYPRWGNRVYFEGTKEAFFEKVNATNQLINSLPLEIQVRTILQDAWANVSHKVIYKGSGQQNTNSERRMARIAAMLEEADEIFQKEIDSWSLLDKNSCEKQPATSKKLTKRFIHQFVEKVLDTEPSKDEVRQALSILFNLGILTEELFQDLMVAVIGALDAAFSSVLLNHLKNIEFMMWALAYWITGENSLFVPTQEEEINAFRHLVNEELFQEVLKRI